MPRTSATFPKFPQIPANAVLNPIDHSAACISVAPSGGPQVYVKASHLWVHGSDKSPSGPSRVSGAARRTFVEMESGISNAQHRTPARNRHFPLRLQVCFVRPVMIFPPSPGKITGEVSDNTRQRPSVFRHFHGTARGFPLLVYMQPSLGTRTYLRVRAHTAKD